MALVDVVVVSYNSRDEIRECVEPLAQEADVSVIVVDSASVDDSHEAIADLPLTRIGLAENRGFGFACNVGWRRGTAPFVLFLNPDARIEGESLRRLAGVLEEDERVGAAAPKIVDGRGALDFSLRRFPRLRSTYAQAFFLHRLFPRVAWSDEVIRNKEAYSRAGTAEWVSGACVLVRRAALEELGGFDESFFLYCEDTDLCKRLWDRGYTVRYEPESLARHEGGASAPRPTLLPVHAGSRLRYAAKHKCRATALLERLGVGLSALTHLLISRGGLGARAGHARALLHTTFRSSPARR